MAGSGGDLFKRWFPRAIRQAAPILQVICFHSAGGESLIFTTKGTKASPMKNPLLDFCAENNVDILPVELPGRVPGSSDPILTSAKEIASKVIDALAVGEVLDKEKKAKSPYVVLAHSMGCLCAYEFLKLLKRLGSAMPQHCFFSSMVAPDVPQTERPWKISAGLNDEELKDECRAWAANSELFKPNIWKLFGPIIREDFKVFDQYEDDQASLDPADRVVPLKIPVTLYHASDDQRATKERMAGWRALVSAGSAESEQLEIKGNHGLYYAAEMRESLMKSVVDRLDRVLLDVEY